MFAPLRTGGKIKMAKEYIMTQESFDKLKERLQYLKTIARKEVSQKISVARDFGDLSENAEYSAAREEQAQIEGEILEIEAKLNHAKILTPDTIDKSVVGIGCKVKLSDIASGREVEYTIVGTVEVDIRNGKISNESPIGKELINKRQGDIISVRDKKFKIISIS